MGEISQYWKNQGVTQKSEGRFFETNSAYLNTQGIFFMCNECCSGDRCDDPSQTTFRRNKKRENFFRNNKPDFFRNLIKKPSCLSFKIIGFITKYKNKYEALSISSTNRSHRACIILLS